ncbi:NAD(P)-binding Rossmann-fold containing protein [Glarea lozoyensis ATCC 20868]|uniref:NAD(P)-binding Rossmann-fold containing protein n=1 Tax=Glarea lozoyensis (strain ATCC 20868 / MF5171) TaxID=1116229 RepID=S3CID2_GLAL2|nr:NAD(P)-binding Rossmann-fold containing protein [Glarea lozoyensis ATCC 20868]EPE26242.1 NAD(P)-binding Rossmann-fold containing protein [Glarea lozoyensis ATCC 20868]
MPTVLLTGSSGFIGFATLTRLLTSNYNVKAILRTSSQIPKIQRGLARSLPLSNLNSNREMNEELAKNVEFIIIPDLSAEGAFDGVLEDVEYIAHVASPMGMDVSDDYERDTIQPAVKMSTNILSAASKIPSIKRIVLISSIGALLDVDKFATGTLKNEPFTASDPIPLYPPHRPYAHPLLAYGASKSLALSAAESYINHHAPTYSLISLLPSLVLGPNYLAESRNDVLATTVRTLIRYVTGEKATMRTLPQTVDVGELAGVVGRCFGGGDKVKEGRYLVAAGEREWSVAKGVVRAKFGGELERGVV